MSASSSGGRRNAAGHASAAGPAVSPPNDAPAEACCERPLHLSPYHNMLQPLDQFVRAVLESAVRLGVLTAQLLSEQCTDACLDAVQAQIKQLEALR